MNDERALLEATEEKIRILYSIYSDLRKLREFLKDLNNNELQLKYLHYDGVSNMGYTYRTGFELRAKILEVLQNEIDEKSQFLLDTDIRFKEED